MNKIDRRECALYNGGLDPRRRHRSVEAPLHVHLIEDENEHKRFVCVCASVRVRLPPKIDPA